MQLLYCNPIYPPSYFHQRYDSISVTTTMYGKVIINTANHSTLPETETASYQLMPNIVDFQFYLSLFIYLVGFFKF